ncbi:ParA family protein [Nocardia sp. NPDC004582]
MSSDYTGWRPPEDCTVIASTHIKGGGTTKTTCAIMSGFAYVRSGKDVDLVSYDNYHSAVAWADKAHEGLGLGGAAHREWPANYGVEPANTEAELYGIIHGSNASRRIIDGGPADPEGLKNIARLSHKIILPTEPGYLTVEQITGAYDLVGEVEQEQGRQIDCRVLFVRVDPSAALTRDIEDALSSVGIPVMKARIRNNTLVARSAHSVPLRLFGYEAVVEELESS